MSLVEAIEAREEAKEVATPAQAAPIPPQKLPPLWRNRDYMLLWSGQAVSTVGSAASGLVFPLLILAVTNSPAAAGVASALYMLPYAIFSLPAGALIDRWDRKRVMIICDGLRALVFIAIPLAMAFNRLTVWQLYLSAFLEGTLFVFFNIAEVAALPRVVPRAQLPNAAAQNQASSTGAWIIGPSVGTFLYQNVSRMAPFIADAVSYLVSVFSLAFIKADFQRERTPKENSSLRAEIAEGVRWMWGQPLLRFMAFLGSGINLILASNSLTLIVLAKNQGASDALIGALFSIAAVGGLLGAVVAARVLKRFGLGATLISSMWVMALAYPLYVIAPNIISLGLVTGILFLALPILSVATLSYRAALVPDELQGRVNSAFRLVSWGSQPIGAFVGGVLLEQIGGVDTVLVCFVGWLVLAVITTSSAQVRNARLGEEA